MKPFYYQLIESEWWWICECLENEQIPWKYLLKIIEAQSLVDINDLSLPSLHCIYISARLVSSVNSDVWGKWHHGHKQIGACLGRAERVSNLSLPRAWFLCCFPVSFELSTKGTLTPTLIIGLFGYGGKGRRTQQLSCLHPVLLVICLRGGIWYRKALLAHSFCLLMTDDGCPVFWLVVGWLRWQMLQWFFWQYSVVLTVQTGNSSFSICTC